MANGKSREKGKRGERLVRDFLKSLGYTSARRGQQYSGVEGRDVVALEELPNIHIEAKFGYDPVDVSSKKIKDWMSQATRDANENDLFPVVLWKPTGARKWRLTCQWYGVLLTTADENDIKLVLEAYGNADPMCC